MIMFDAIFITLCLILLVFLMMVDMTNHNQLPKLKVWLDDMRPVPGPSYTYCRTAEEVIELLKTGNVAEVDLDNDLGTGYTEGVEVARWIAAGAESGKLKRIICYCHSQNPERHSEMVDLFRQAHESWNRHECNT
jgi:hypothetical protein